MVMNNLRKSLVSFLVTGLLFIPAFLWASGEEGHQADSTVVAEKFHPGPFIIDHIGDAYSWHILDFKNKEGHVVECAVPLPVILYSQEKGLNIFWSSRFAHGHAAYKGFQIAESGKHKGKIVEILADGSEVTPIDLSISKLVFSLLFSVAMLIWMFLSIASAYKRNPNHAPRGLQSLMEPIILFIRDDIAKSMIGEKRYARYVPYLLTIFFFIFFNNLMGLVPIFPGGANLTGNIAVTMVLALFTFAISSYSGNKAYWVHLINMPGVPWWLKIPIPLMPFIEIMSFFIKPLVLMIRLFANITAGHIIPLGFISLIFIFGEMNIYLGYGVSIVSLAFMLFMALIEVLVALIQAYVFTLLSALYFGMAAEEHSHQPEKEHS
jgi:F-type H+-transporting ATPase subunit a